ncbi:MAG: hypothetical protein ACLT29_04985 [Ruminococcus callidus]
MQRSDSAENADVCTAADALQYLQLLFNAADIVVVGKFAGDNSLAAVGSNTALINLLTNLFIDCRSAQT